MTYDCECCPLPVTVPCVDGTPFLKLWLRGGVPHRLCGRPSLVVYQGANYVSAHWLDARFRPDESLPMANCVIHLPDGSVTELHRTARGEMKDRAHLSNYSVLKNVSSKPRSERYWLARDGSMSPDSGRNNFELSADGSVTGAFLDNSLRFAEREGGEPNVTERLVHQGEAVELASWVDPSGKYKARPDGGASWKLRIGLLEVSLWADSDIGPDGVSCLVKADGKTIKEIRARGGSMTLDGAPNVVDYHDDFVVKSFMTDSGFLCEDEKPNIILEHAGGVASYRVSSDGTMVQPPNPGSPVQPSETGSGSKKTKTSAGTLRWELKFDPDWVEISEGGYHFKMWCKNGVIVPREKEAPNVEISGNGPLKQSVFLDFKKGVAKTFVGNRLRTEYRRTPRVKGDATYHAYLNSTFPRVKIWLDEQGRASRKNYLHTVEHFFRRESPSFLVWTDDDLKPVRDEMNNAIYADFDAKLWLDENFRPRADLEHNCSIYNGTKKIKLDADLNSDSHNDVSKVYSLVKEIKLRKKALGPLEEVMDVRGMLRKWPLLKRFVEPAVEPGFPRAKETRRPRTPEFRAEFSDELESPPASSVCSEYADEILGAAALPHKNDFPPAREESLVSPMSTEFPAFSADFLDYQEPAKTPEAKSPERLPPPPEPRAFRAPDHFHSEAREHAGQCQGNCPQVIHNHVYHYNTYNTYNYR